MSKNQLLDSVITILLILFFSSACATFEPTATTTVTTTITSTSTIPLPAETITTSSQSSSIALLGTTILYTDGLGLHSYPKLPVFQHPEIQKLYASASLIEFVPNYLIQFRPQLSHTGNTLLVPGLGDREKTWLLDLAQGASRQVVNKPVIGVWNPQGTRFAYADKGLYIYDVTLTNIEPTLIFETSKEPGHVTWSPDGDWIAVVEPTNKGGPTVYDYNFWLVSPSGEITRLLGTFPLPATELTTETVLRWSPDGSLIWIGSDTYLTPEGKIVDQTELLHSTWIFCNTQRHPFQCVQQKRTDEMDDYTRVGLKWVLCQQQFWGLSHDCTQRAVAYQNKLYLNDLVSGQQQQVAVVDRDIHTIYWAPDSQQLIFSTLPQEYAGVLQAEVYRLSLDTGEISLLPIQGIIVDVIPSSITDEKNNLIQPLNLSQTIDGITIVVEQAYLDADRVVVEFTFVEPEGRRFDLQNIRLTHLPDMDLPATGVGGGSNDGRYHLRFDASNIQDMPRQLDLQFVIYAEEWFYTPEIIELVEQYGSHKAIPPDKMPRKFMDSRGDKIGPFIFDFKIPLEND